jgi:uncharacterized protein
MQQPGSATTPGVHISELSIFPPSVVGVQTAVPAFIGYTETAEAGGTPVPFTPVQIGSLADYQQTFGGAFRRQYALVPAAADGFDVQAADPASGAPSYYRVEPVVNGFNLYDGMRLFFENGGGPCYVVSTGTYADAEGATRPVAKADLLQGLAAIGEQAGPTMLVIPDAVSLPPDAPAQPWISADFAAVTQAMLEQCATLQDRVALLDVYGTTALVPGGPSLDDVANAFHLAVRDAGLSYGMAYFPFLNTTVVDPSEIDYGWITDAPGAQPGLLARLLTAQNQALYGDPANPAVPTDRQQAVQAQIDAIAATPDAVLNASLLAALPLLASIEALVVQRQNVLPPSPAMAGVFTFMDGSSGVWTAPANVTVAGVQSVTVPIDDAQQSALNVPVDGKAIDVLRDFPGRGTVVWGARTLDGNSNDYRYIQVRRTINYIGQSIKQALNRFTFAPNDASTWTTVVATLSSFLTELWSQGGLMGNSPADAFRVACGLGTTMTAQDILDGYMNVEVTVAIIHPAEFIALTFQQQMQGVA